MTDRTSRKRQVKAEKARRRSVNSGVRASPRDLGDASRPARSVPMAEALGGARLVIGPGIPIVVDYEGDLLWTQVA